jgi:serine/threonine-protein kinase SRK2
VLPNALERLASSMQLKDINRGAFGVVVLAEERATGQQVAIKFIKRGPKV